MISRQNSHANFRSLLSTDTAPAALCHSRTSCAHSFIRSVPSLRSPAAWRAPIRRMRRPPPIRTPQSRTRTSMFIQRRARPRSSSIATGMNATTGRPGSRTTTRANRTSRRISRSAWSRCRRRAAAPPGAVTGAVIGSGVAGRHDSGEGAVAGAIVGAMIGASSDAARSKEAEQAGTRVSAETQAERARLERQASDYRRAISACLEGRGYTVR